MEEPLAYSIEEAACLLGISRTKAYECVRAGQLRTIQLGRRLLVPAAAVDAFLGTDQLRTRRRAVERAVEEGLNRVEVVGRLTRDGELRPTRTGSSLCPLRVAIRRRHGDDVVFVDLSVFGEEARRASQLRKGQMVWVVGRLDHREWTAEDGSRREAHQIVASRIEALDPPRAESNKCERNQDAGRIGNGSRA
ncbi:MAG: single-stranded DNA-binding protein [Actinobacteria bacterium]|nr:single-stranded DNA-binding protein [Actinomycetota bacterium]